MQCPNINHPEFKALAAKHGETLAYYEWAVENNNGEEESSPLNMTPYHQIKSESFAEFHSTKDGFFATNVAKDISEDGDGKYIGAGIEGLSITNHIIPIIQTRPYSSTDTPGDRAAEKAWRGRDPNDLLSFPDLTIGAISKERYVQLINQKFETGRAKGEILHLSIHEYLTKDPEVRKQIYALMKNAEILSSEVDWLDNKAIRAMLDKTGTDYNSSKGTDKVYSEKIIGTPILNWYGTVDLFVDHGDHIYSIHDLKTGLRFNRVFEDSFFKYGRTSTADIFDTARNRAKLQIMLYAFITKINNPKARFRNLDILYIRNQWSIADHDPYKAVNVPAFLEIIQNTLKYEHAEDYARLQKEVPHFAQLFDAGAYVSFSNADFDSNHPKVSSSDRIAHKMRELQSAIMYDSIVKDIHTKVPPDIGAMRKNIAKLMEEIIELKKDPAVNMAITDVNMGWMDAYLGSQSYSTNPYVQLYYKELSKSKQLARDNNHRVTRQFDILLAKLIKSKGLVSVSRFIGGVNREKLFAFAFKTDAAVQSKHRLIHDDDAEFKNLTPIEKEFLNFINTHIAAVFEKNYMHLLDPNAKDPVANKVVTIRKWRGQEMHVTNLDLHNKLYSVKHKDARSDQFTFYKGFFPKFAPQIDDIIRLHGGFFTKPMLDFIYNRYTTTYFENEFEQWDNEDEAIPMKYLGSQDIDNNENYTLNLEQAFKSFIKHHIYKNHLDEVYTMGQAMRIYLDNQISDLSSSVNADKDQVQHVKRLNEFFEKSVDLHLLGRKQRSFTLSSRKSGRIKDKRFQEFNWVKFLRSLKTFFAGPTMWLKPLSGIPNFVFASLVTIKEGIKTSLGLSTSNAKFGLSEMMFGFKEAFKLIFWDGASNNAYRNNKTYILMEKFGYLPDNHDWYTSNNEMLTARNQLFTSRTMMMFHSMPEEVIATALFVAQMKAMKFTKQDGTESNMWDSYEQKDTTLDDGTKHTVVEWTGGKRGVRNISNDPTTPKYEDVEGMTIEELNAIKFLYEKIHGGYRGDEKVIAEYYVMGELYLQMKKYMPAILKNVWASKGIRQTQGNFIEEVDENGTKIMKWTPQVIEGRFKVIMGLMLNFIGYKQETTEGGKGNKIAKLLGFQFDSTQSWDKLSPAQKEDIHDFILTFSMFFLMYIGYMKLWDRGDDDTLKKLYKRVQDDFASNVNPLELIKNIKNAGIPTAINRSYQLLEGTAELALSMMSFAAGYDDAALTKEGNFRGSANVKRNLHITAPFYDWTTKMENMELYQEYLK
jgi:hypothetical protein